MNSTILIADDDPVQRRLLEGMIRRFGYEVEAVESGELALARMQAQGAPNVALLATAAYWVLLDVFADRHWLGTVVAYTPRFFAYLPTVLVLPIAAVTRHKWHFLANLGGLLVAIFVIGGVEFPGLCRSGPPERTVTLVVQNLAHRNEAAAMAKLVEAHKPDILLLQECQTDLQEFPAPSLQLHRQLCPLLQQQTLAQVPLLPHLRQSVAGRWLVFVGLAQSAAEWLLWSLEPLRTDMPAQPCRTQESHAYQRFALSKLHTLVRLPFSDLHEELHLLET